jgi:hypothetical protein
MEEKKKTAEEKAKEHTADNLVNYLVATTFARHSQLSEEEFLEEIGFAGSGKTEEEAIRIAIFNVLVASMNEFLKARQGIKMVHSLIKTCLVDEKITKEEEKGE